MGVIMKKNLKIFLVNLLLLFSFKLNCDIVQIENDVYARFNIYDVQIYRQDVGDAHITKIPLYQSAIRFKEVLTLSEARSNAELNIRCFIFHINNYTSKLIWTSNNKNQKSKIKISEIIDVKLPFKKIGNFYIQKIPNEADLANNASFKPLNQMLKENPFFMEKAKAEPEQIEAKNKTRRRIA